MEAEVAAYRAEKARNPTYTNDALHQTIRNSLHKLYILLGCAVRLKKQPHDDINLALRPFGFKLDQPPARVDNRDLMLVGMAVMAGSVLLLGFAAVEAAHLRLWAASDVFPQTWYQPLIDTIEAVVIYGAGIFMADFVRKRRIRKGSWFRSNGLIKWPSGGNYVRIAFASAVAGYIGSILWGLAFRGITIDQLKLTAPFMLLPAATGAFYVYHLDNIELNLRPSRLRELSWQTIGTAICGLIAASASFAVLFGDVSPVTDQILLKAAISAAVGFSLAWYIPDAGLRPRRGVIRSRWRGESGSDCLKRRRSDASAIRPWLPTGSSNRMARWMAGRRNRPPSMSKDTKRQLAFCRVRRRSSHLTRRAADAPNARPPLLRRRRLRIPAPANVISIRVPRARCGTIRYCEPRACARLLPIEVAKSKRHSAVGCAGNALRDLAAVDDDPQARRLLGDGGAPTVRVRAPAASRARASCRGSACSR